MDTHIHFSLFFCLLSVNDTQGITYYVATTGNDSNAGTSINSPWRTIQKAADNVSANDIVYIKAGNYGCENVVFDASGTQTAPITFEGYQITPGDNPVVDYRVGDTLSSDDMPLLDGGNRATAGIAFYGNAKTHIVLKNIQIQNYNTGVYGYCVDNCVFENIIAINMGDLLDSYDGFGIRIVGGSNDRVISNIVRRCVVANNGAEGLLIAYGDYNRIENCQAYCNDTDSVNSGMDYYIEILHGNYNTISGCYAERGSGVLHGGHGIELKGTCAYNVIKDSVSVNHGGGGFS